MDLWFDRIAASAALDAATARALDVDGFVVIPGPVPAGELGRLSEAYDRSMAGADPADTGIGRTTTRVHDFVNRGAEFDCLYVYPPVLAACCRVLGRPFQLSAMHGRTLRPRMGAQDLHVDFARDAEGWTLVGFILMVDEFRMENGATQFRPGSHREENDAPLVAACGAAGSLIVFNGSVLHGHGVNETERPRRSIQGAYIRRDGERRLDMAVRMRPETLGRISELARYVLAV